MVNENLAQDRRPEGWGESPLFTFVENCWGNSLATFERHRAICKKLEQIDAVLDGLASKMTGRQHSDFTLPLLLGRALGAFRSSVVLGLCMGTDAFGPIRSGLEHAGYAHLIFTDPAMGVVWINSIYSDVGATERRKQFEVSKIKRSISARLPPNTDVIFGSLYKRSLEFGAHPNPLGVFSQASANTDTLELTLGLLGNESAETREHTLKSCAQSGLMVALLFCDIFEKEATAGGFPATLASISKDL